jgi:hypothetical protein
LFIRLINTTGKTIAQTLTAMIDGFWVESLIAADRYRAENGIKACFAYLERFFPKFRAT